MLRFLSVTDFALIRFVELSLGPGLTILTGETGAGKTILMDALGVALGGRSSSIAVREGASRAVIQAAFDPPPAAPLEEAGLLDIVSPLSCDEVILVREVARDGKGRVTVNGTLAPVNRLRDLGELLADLHGQGDQQSLLQPSWQLRYLDGIAALASEGKELRERHHRLIALDRERDLVLSLHRERDRRLGLLSFERDELRRARLTIGEEEELRETKRLLSSGEKVTEHLAEAIDLLTGTAASEGEQPGVLGLLARLQRACDKLAIHAGSLGSTPSTIHDIAERCREVEAQLSRLSARLDYDPAELDRVESRLHEIDRLRRKYATDVSGLIKRLEDVERECAELEGASDRLAHLEAERERAIEECRVMAEEMSRRRREAARRVEKGTEALLGDLSLPRARVEVALSRKPPGDGPTTIIEGAPCGLDATGVDDVEILVALNPGEAPRPLRRVASGGEISRLMLALKLLASADEGPPTLVFDEVDAGVSGRAAEDVGRKLRSLARGKQVLCITHLPQVACFGHSHIEVCKEIRGDRAVVTARPLADAERKVAIARLLAGAEITPAALRHASELLERGQA